MGRFYKIQMAFAGMLAGLLCAPEANATVGIGQPGCYEVRGEVDSISVTKNEIVLVVYRGSRSEAFVTVHVVGKIPFLPPNQRIRLAVKASVVGDIDAQVFEAKAESIRSPITNTVDENWKWIDLQGGKKPCL